MSEIKFNCSYCDQHIVCGIDAIGQQCACPTCGSPLTVPDLTVSAQAVGQALIPGIGSTQTSFLGLHGATWKLPALTAFTLLVLLVLPTHTERLDVRRTTAISYSGGSHLLAEVVSVGLPLAAWQFGRAYPAEISKLREQGAISTSIESGGARIGIDWNAQKAVAQFDGVPEIQIDLQTSKSNFLGGNAVHIVWASLLQDLVFDVVSICAVAFIVQRRIAKKRMPVAASSDLADAL